MEHRLRLDPEPFEAMLRGERTAEHRWASGRAFMVGDVAVIEQMGTDYAVRRRIVGIDRGPDFGIRNGYAVLHLGPMEEE